jgi:ADP-ribose pyrophosphatase
MATPWRILASREVADCKIFKVTERVTESPHTGKSYPFYVLKARDWVVTIPLTRDGKVVLVKQFRHGTREFTIEVPAGVIEPGEAPEHAARRELLEETGFSGGEFRELGRVHSNPAFVENTCDVHLDETEAIETEVVPLSDIPPMIAEGQITHAIAIAAFHLLGLEEA